MKAAALQRTILLNVIFGPSYVIRQSVQPNISQGRVTCMPVSVDMLFPGLGRGGSIADVGVAGRPNMNSTPSRVHNCHERQQHFRPISA